MRGSEARAPEDGRLRLSAPEALCGRRCGVAEAHSGADERDDVGDLLERAEVRARGAAVRRLVERLRRGDRAPLLREHSVSRVARAREVHKLDVAESFEAALPLRGRYGARETLKAQCLTMHWVEFFGSLFE